MHELVIIIAQYFVAIPVLAWFVVLWRLPKDRRLSFVVLTAVSVVVTAVLAKLASTLHADPRPYIRDGVHPYFAGSHDNGFPSDHTTYSALLALVILRSYRWVGGGLVIIAILIGSARVVAGVHHGQDIVGGLVVAAIGVGISVFVESFIRHRLTSRRSAQPKSS